MMLELPPFRMWLEKEVTRDGEWVSSWTIDRSELLGGERSVFYWLHAICKRSREDAIRLTRLYYRVRDEGDCFPGRPFVIEDVAAGIRRDVAPHAWMFDALAHATWCVACRANPQVVGSLCAWCARAPIADLYS
jgi:hypothetical protein